MATAKIKSYGFKPRRSPAVSRVRSFQSAATPRSPSVYGPDYDPSGRLGHGPYGAAPTLSGALANPRPAAQAPAAGGGGGRGGAGPQRAGPPVAHPGDATPWEADPVLMRIRALAGGHRGDAQSGARKAREEVAVNYGLPELADTLGLGQSIGDAARQNPMSSLARLHQQGEQEGTDLTEGLNHENLLFGGHAGLARGKLAQALLGQEADLRGEAQGRLNTISDALLAAEQGSYDDETSAELEAYQKWLEGGGSVSGAPLPPSYANTVTGLTDPAAYEQAFGLPPDQYMAGTINSALQPGTAGVISSSLPQDQWTIPTVKKPRTVRMF